MPAPPRIHRRCTKTLCPARRRVALSLFELLFTIAIIGILAAILIPQLSGNLPDRLNAGAQVVCADLDYARSLAVSNNSNYRITFEPDNNRYYLRHSGASAALNTLPRSPFRQNDDPADRQTTNLSQLPLPEPGIRLVAAVQMQGAGQSATQIEFTPLGATTSSLPTVIWLRCGGGTQQRFISIEVDPVTGLAEIGPLRTALPASIASIVQSIAPHNVSAQSAKTAVTEAVGP